MFADTSDIKTKKFFGLKIFGPKTLEQFYTNFGQSKYKFWTKEKLVLATKNVKGKDVKIAAWLTIAAMSNIALEQDLPFLTTTNSEHILIISGCFS